MWLIGLIENKYTSILSLFQCNGVDLGKSKNMRHHITSNIIKRFHYHLTLLNITL